MKYQQSYAANTKMTRTQYNYLKTRYGKNDRTSANILAKLAILEVVYTQAKKELKDGGTIFDDNDNENKILNWSKEIYNLIEKMFIEPENNFDCELDLKKLIDIMDRVPPELKI